MSPEPESPRPPAPIPVPAPDAGPEEGDRDPGSYGASSFWLHTLTWVLFHATVVIAWGQRNSWPDELLLCLLTVPISFMVAWDLYQSQGFGLRIEPNRGQQEQLIAALVLAVGLASGQLLLMSGGLVCLGVAWLRPAKPGVDWTEWLKIPLLFLGALPFWLDFEAGRHPFVGLLSDPECNPVFALPLALGVSQALLLGYGGLVAMVLFLHGRIFWLVLPALPAYVLLVTALPRWIPAWRSLPGPVRFWGPWLLGALLLWVFRHYNHIKDRGGRPLATGQTLRLWFSERRYPPWLAILVVAVVQALPFQGFKLDPGVAIELGGLVLLAGILGLYRLRTPKGPIHSRSVAMVAGALSLTLLAEFAASDSIRHLAMGFVIIGLFSWHCFWPLRIFVIATAAVVALFGASPDGITSIPPLLASPASRALAGAVLLGVLAWMTTLPLPIPGAQGYQEEGWIPSKRFALILLGLMMVFQTASAFWPEYDPGSGSAPRGVASGVLPTESEPEDEPDEAGNPAVRRFRHGQHVIDVAILQPRNTPYLVVSPERSLERRGWKVLESTRIPHPKGEASCVRLERDGRELVVLWWFELGERAFANPLYARRVLWSSWHLADRHLRLVRLEAGDGMDFGRLTAFAREQKWFSAGLVQARR